MVKEKGKVFVITGPSGVGKTTIANRIMGELKSSFKRIITCTTRAPREGEQNDVDYHFFSKEQFESMLKKEAFFEWAKVYDNYYGSLKTEVEEVLELGKNVLMVLDNQGAITIKQNHKNAITIFIKPPTIEELKERLESRGKDSQEVIDKRTKIAEQEIMQMGLFDFVVVNDIVEDAVIETKQIIQERYKKIRK